MAIDMTTVKQIMHNNKEVVKIEDGLGKVLWQKKAEPQWHTLWSGSEYAKIYTTSTDKHWRSEISNTNALATIPLEAMGSGCRLRITWSYEWGIAPFENSRFYQTNNGPEDIRSVPAQPYVIDTISLGTSTTWVVIGIVANADNLVKYKAKAYLKWNSDTRELSLDASYGNGEWAKNNRGTITVTQIEAYY